MCCCLVLGVVNHSVLLLLLLLLLPGYPEFFLHVRLETSALTHVGRSSMNNKHRWPTSQVMVLLVQWTAASATTTVTMVIGGDYSSDQAEKMDSSHARHRLVNIVTNSACSGEPNPITDWIINPDNKQLAFAPCIVPFDPPTYPWGDSRTQPIQQQQH